MNWYFLRIAHPYGQNPVFAFERKKVSTHEIISWKLRSVGSTSAREET